jgi:hypothetical protein
MIVGYKHGFHSPKLQKNKLLFWVIFFWVYDKLHNEKVIFVFYAETLFLPYSKKQNNLSSIRSLEQNKTLLPY